MVTIKRSIFHYKEVNRLNRLEQINDKWGNYKTETTKGMQELCLDFEWLLTMVEESKEFLEWATDISLDKKVVQKGKNLLKKIGE
ncbi:hypothetical protein PP175_26140 (plasmid) [Aneurinibacillus sp. Ricciae_BoGa-3]|uniref:hypothetical protein n=1 Tax=Aneurinibacillus sp. Ricciae_BoGa-3 TaxID=3022697 RepID=UPI002341575B|nr:hypothetical protein [Aneurinibacillus sp. Ricciae_BoGa-3]WCK57548.1 hypothetical protein PP175_26140 [Aneurinibacillus sp. Ricciae_BoGa-3]